MPTRTKHGSMVFVAESERMDKAMAMQDGYGAKEMANEYYPEVKELIWKSWGGT